MILAGSNNFQKRKFNIILTLIDYFMNDRKYI